MPHVTLLAPCMAAVGREERCSLPPLGTAQLEQHGTAGHRLTGMLPAAGGA